MDIFVLCWLGGLWLERSVKSGDLKFKKNPNGIVARKNLKLILIILIALLGLVFNVGKHKNLLVAITIYIYI